MKYDVYNLVFPPWCDSISAGGYCFSRVPDYRDRYLALQHRVGGHGEFYVQSTFGSHQVTAQVQCTEIEAESILFPNYPSHTSLDDLLLLLSLFTQRHVFTLWGHEKEAQHAKRLRVIPPGAILTADCRQFFRGGIANASIEYEKKEGGTGSHGYYDGSLETTLRSTMSLISKPEWQAQFGRGSFLLIYREVIASERLETAFTLAWAMWEHLFSVQNRTWLDKKTRVTSREKILYVAYKVLGIDDSMPMRKRIDDLVQARNSLVHFGAIPQDNNAESFSHRESLSLFLELSEMVIVQALRLGSPSNMFNTIERLDGWLAEKRHQQASV
jgi:hypothetical protein